MCVVQSILGRRSSYVEPDPDQGRATALGNTAVTHPSTNAEFSLGLAGGSLTMMVLVTIAGIVAFGADVVWHGT